MSTRKSSRRSGTGKLSIMSLKLNTELHVKIFRKNLNGSNFLLYDDTILMFAIIACLLCMKTFTTNICFEFTNSLMKANIG